MACFRGSGRVPIELSTTSAAAAAAVRLSVCLSVTSVSRSGETCQTDANGVINTVVVVVVVAANTVHAELQRSCSRA